MKQRFSSLDVKVIAHELSNTLVSLRVGNIYDLSSKIFLIKFAKPEHKEQIVIDSGFRCHLTDFSRATASTPSVFVARLRKALKTRRVTSVSQVGTDRILEFQFSDGLYRLYLEFYASGNVILTDRELNIVALLRIVPEGEGQEEQRVGLKYSLENRQNYNGIPELTKQRLKDGLQKAVDKGETANVSAKKAKPRDALRKALAVSITEFAPMLVDHAMRVTGFDSTLKPAEVLESEDRVDHLLRSLQEAQRVITQITSSQVAKGYIIAKKKEGYVEGDTENNRERVIYDDFHAFRPNQFENDPTSVFLEIDGFNKTVDEFFSSIEGQRLTSKLEEREIQAKKKIESARQDQAKRLGGLQEIQELNERKAAALQANVERVQEAMDAVNGLIAQGMDWVEIGKLIELEQKRNNPVASFIKLPLKLEENTITVLLDEEDFGAEDESADETDSESESENEVEAVTKKGKAVDNRLTIDIDLALSPWANAREYFDQKRTAADKEQKTLQSSTKALKSQEAKIAHDLKKGLKQEKAVLRPVRRLMWFEKFIWFISSDGYLVLAGKDALQNEMLYKKYLKKGDIYLHADLDGAATVVIRNNPKTPDAPVPPSTLSQAGSLAVACSSAWDSKASMAAWWVNSEQVSKSAPTGEFLPTGSFMVRGKKNFLPPTPLLLGFGILFQISEDSKAQHVKHRLQDESKELSDSVQENGTVDALGKDGDAAPEVVEDSDSELDHNQSDDEEEPEIRANPLQSQAEPRIIDDEDDEDDGTDEVAALNIKDDVEEPEELHRLSNLDENASQPESEAESQPPTGTQTPSQTKKGPAPAKRGKRGKAKKIATKYKDQDEEDRLAAQELIGATAGQEKARLDAATKAAREAEAAFQKERRRAQHQRTQQETAEHEQIRKLMLEESPDLLDPEEEDKMTALDSLVGTPFKGDEILEAIPVCAPWSAMGNYKYSVKLQPGTLKKGKAVKEILHKWTELGEKTKGKIVDEKSEDPERMWPREVQLLKALRVEEVTNTVPVSRVRVVISGGAGGSVPMKGKGKGGRGKGSKNR